MLEWLVRVLVSLVRVFEWLVRMLEWLVRAIVFCYSGWPAGLSVRMTCFVRMICESD